MSSQVSAIIYFFLSRNIRIARERAYEQTIQSRGKGPDWWRPYVEEWDNPPKVVKVSWGWSVFMSGPVGRIVAKGGTQIPLNRGYRRTLTVPHFEVIAFPLHFVPFAGMFIVAWFRALGTARYLHEPVSPTLFRVLHMLTPPDVAVLQGEAHDS